MSRLNVNEAVEEVNEDDRELSVPMAATLECV